MNPKTKKQKTERNMNQNKTNPGGGEFFHIPQTKKTVSSITIIPVTMIPYPPMYC